MAAIGRAIEGLPALKLTGLHVLTTLMGSALLAVAVLKGRLSLEEQLVARLHPQSLHHFLFLLLAQLML